MVGLLLLKSLYFFLPAYFANMAPTLFNWIPWGSKSVWEDKLGKNKTWRGLIVGTVVGGVVFILQKLAYTAGFRQIALIDYNGFSLLLGLLLGAGGLLGDMVKSYYKRKEGILPGVSWMPWDQLDFVIGGLVLCLFLYVPAPEVVLVLLIISPVLHIVVNYCGYLLGIQKNKF